MCATVTKRPERKYLHQEMPDPSHSPKIASSFGKEKRREQNPAFAFYNVVPLQSFPKLSSPLFCGFNVLVQP